MEKRIIEERIGKTIETLLQLKKELFKYKEMENWLDKKQNKKEKIIDIQEIFIFLRSKNLEG